MSTELITISYDLIHFILPIIIINFLIGIISWPVTSLFFNKSSDKGYSYAHVIGWFGLAYLIFISVTIESAIGWVPLPLGKTTVFLFFILWMLINLVILIKFRNSFASTYDAAKTLNFRQIIKIQINFLFIMIFWYWVRAHDPAIYQIERFMDFGFINSLFNAKTLPLFDFWMAGKTVNYYYFGHFIAYVILTLSGVATMPGFFALIAWMFALCAIIFYRFGKDFMLQILMNEKITTTPLMQSYYDYLGTISGWLSMFFVLLAGTLHSILWIGQYANYLLFKWVSPYTTGLAETQVPAYWYADATRFIGNIISEMPIYGFMVSDLRGNMWGLFTGLIVLLALTKVWFETEKPLRNRYIYLITFFIGTAYMTNSWDALTLGILTITIVILKYKEIFINNLLFIKNNLHKHIHRKDLVKNLDFCIIALIPIAAYAVALPWSLAFKAPLSGIGLVSTPSIFWKWFLFWGGFLIITGLFLIKTSFKLERGTLLIQFTRYNTFQWIVAIVSGFFLIFCEIFYFKDILNEGDWYRANTPFKLYFQIWLWLGLLMGPMIVWLVTKSKGLIKYLSTAIIIVIIFIKVLYPIKGINQAFLHINLLPNNKFSIGKTTGITKGLQWWQNLYPSDYEAYQFLEAEKSKLPEKQKTPVIVEGDGDSFSDNNYFSTFLGWPTIIGWAGHEWTWRGSYNEVGTRRAEVAEIYTGEDAQKTQEILKKYNVAYIVVGEYERTHYEDNLKELKLIQLGSVIFRNADTMVIKVRNI